MNTLPPAVATLVDAAGGVPDPHATEMQFRRWRHHDLADLSDEALEGERTMVLIAWAALVRNPYMHVDRERDWFSGRRAAVLAEVERRRRSRRP